MIRSRCGFDSNIYLLKGRSALLIDAGSGLDESVADSVAASLGDLELTAVLLTHCHADHVGGLRSILNRFGCPAYISQIDRRPVCEPDLHITFADRLHVPLGPVECESFGPDSMFDIGAHRLTVLETPGHTAGSVCLYDEVTHSLFSGDTVFARGFGRTDLPTGSYYDLFRSLHKLLNVNIGTIYPGHGPDADDGGRVIADAISMMGILN